MKTKKMLALAAFAVGLMFAQLATAQAPAGAPAGSTGLCNDGTYFKGSVKIGACSGHKGLKTWYGAAAKTAAPTMASKPVAPPAAMKPSAAPAGAPASPGPAPTKTTAAPMAQAAGAGTDKVWVNTASNVYHCPGTQYYGKTKAGAYMTEADAKGKGAHPVGGKPCFK